MMRAAGASLALLGCAVLAGCTSTAEPPPVASPSPSLSVRSSAPSNSASPSPTPPVLPSEAQGTSPAAAKAFARHFFDAVNYAAATGDTAELRTLGTADCVSCDAIASNIEDIYGAGGSITAENWQINTLRVIQSDEQATVLAIGALLAPEVIVSENGSAKTRPGGKQPMTLFLAPADSSFTVSKLDFVT